MVTKREGLGVSHMHILVLQGPNLNLLGEREKGVYGLMTLEDLHLQLLEDAGSMGVKISFFQSNHEGALIDRIHDARVEGVDGVIINPGGLTHTSVSLRDALVGTVLPFIEVHISNVYAREEFRHHSFLSAKAAGVIAGLGGEGYRLALQGLVHILEGRKGEGKG